MLQSKPLILVDGSSYLYRAFHGMPALSNSKSFPTGAIYGVINMLKKLLNDYQPAYMAVIFDTKAKTFREELYAEYKATRKEMPDDLARQVEPIHNIISAMGLPLIAVEGVEADDVIGTLAQHAMKAGMQTIISTSDKDMAQLVNEHITLVNTMTNTVMDIAGVKAKFGVLPELIIDYLALVGDTSDNIPGVPQVGPKTAVKWLNEYGSLQSAIDNANSIIGKVGDNFRAFIPHLPLTKQLVTIKLDVPLTFDFNELELKAPDHEKLKEWYKELEFKAWLSDVLKSPSQTSSRGYKANSVIFTAQELDTWLNQLKTAKEFAFDTETTSLDTNAAEIVGVSFAINKGEAAYIPVGHDYADAPKQLNRDDVLAKLKPLLEDNNIKKIGQNIKYDIEVLANYNIHMQGVAFDTMLEAYVLDSSTGGYDMDSLALKHLGWKAISYQDVAGKGAKQIPFNLVPIDIAADYAAEDADVTLCLHQTLWPRLKKDEKLKYVIEKIEIPLIPVLACMERIGVFIDPNKLREQGKELQLRLNELEAVSFTIAGEEFNMNSPKQLQEVLFQKLKLPILQKTPTGQASTADAVLQELALEFELPRLIIEYRSLSKLMSTYTNRLVEQINPKTQRIHTSYNQTGTTTGRLSSSDPNLQNIPIRSKEGRRIRQAFIAPSGYKILSADYSQIELRIMAHISKDPGLLYAFENNLDVHIATAAEVWEVPLDKVTSDMRRGAKAINFGLIYGMSAFGLTRQLGVDRKAAQEYIDKYFTRYPKVKAYMDNARAKAHETGYVETLWGRRLYIPDINASQIPRQKAAERAAINAPLQGSAADIIKMAMINIHAWLKENHFDAKMIMQVHDELVFEVADKDVEIIQEGVIKRMREVAQLQVPLLVAVGIGDNWDKASDH